MTTFEKQLGFPSLTIDKIFRLQNACCLSDPFLTSEVPLYLTGVLEVGGVVARRRSEDAHDSTIIFFYIQRIVYHKAYHS